MWKGLGKRGEGVIGKMNESVSKIHRPDQLAKCPFLSTREKDCGREKPRVRNTLEETK